MKMHSRLVDSRPADSGPLAADLVDANRILFHLGIVDGFGHVSLRHDRRPDHFLLAANVAPGRVERQDIIEFDEEANPVAADGRRLYLERFIHSEIYRARPDVQAVVHSHSPAVLPFSVVRSVRLRPVCHMCGFLGAGAPVFDTRVVAGASDLLIRDRPLGQALALRLGTSNVVLMRGHGSTVVAPTLRLAVYRAVYTEVNARLLADALRLGPVEFLTPAEAEAALATESQADRAWDLWRAEALGR